MLQFLMADYPRGLRNFRLRSSGPFDIQPDKSEAMVKMPLMLLAFPVILASEAMSTRPG